MNWLLLLEIAYIIILILVCLKVMYDTRSSTKTLAYLLLVVFLPFIGIVIYFSFGINYRKRKMYTKKLYKDDKLAKRVQDVIVQHSQWVLSKNILFLNPYKKLSNMLITDGLSELTANNEVKLLINGEQKFPMVLQTLENAKHHIHIEYYIYEDDGIGQEIEDVLKRKAREGVEVRFIYDDFGARSIARRMVKRLKEAGVQVFPFYRIIFIALANRLNYRNHRKIIVVDGIIGFIGGINVSDKYINYTDKPDKLYWRDTHLYIKGGGVYGLQHLFLCDWNFCAKDYLQPTQYFFPQLLPSTPEAKKIVQIAASGPDSENPTILYSLLQAINLATEEILITTPYFIPGESILDALTIAVLGGVKVKILVPGISDSYLVNFAARSYYDELLKVGAEIYLYQKGFMHAKTLVIDEKVAVIGTANMDYRSFELNFEVNAQVYDAEIASQLKHAIYDDIGHTEKLDYVTWQNRPIYKQLFEKVARLLSPML